MEKCTWESKIYDIRDGICAFVNVPGLARSNVGMAAGDKFGIFIDAMGTGELSHWFQTEAQKRTDKPIPFCVYTHSHGDHVFGAHGYHGVYGIMTEQAQKESYDDKDAPDPAMLGKHPVYKAGDSFRTLPLDIVFRDSITINLGGRTARIMDFGWCHTTSDVVVHIPEEKIVFAGDLLFNKIGFMGGTCRFANWIAAIDRLLELDADIYVPGHGPIATREDVREDRDYLSFLYETAKAGKAAGISPLDLAEDTDIGKYESWQEPERIVLNFETMYRELDGQEMYPPKKPAFNAHAERIRMAKEGRRIHRKG